MWKVVLALAATAGCSFATVKGPRASPGRYLQCTTSRAVPIADLVVGGSFVLAGAGVAYWDRNDDEPSTGAKTFAITLPAIAVGVAFLAASQYGTSRVSRCREAHSMDRRWRE